MYETEEQLFICSGYDDDGDTLYFNWELDSVTVSTDSTYFFTTDYTSAGIYILTCALRDSLESFADTTFSWTVEVLDVDQPVVTDSISPPPGLVDMAEGDTLLFLYSGHDPDGNPLSYDWLLDSLSVASDSVFLYSPDYSSAGLHALLLNVSDNYTRHDTSFAWTINVTDVDQFIVTDSIFPLPGPVDLAEGDSLLFFYSGYDPDGDTLTYEWLLDSLLLATDSSFLYTPDFFSAGLHGLELTVSDNFSTRNDTSFTWTISVADVDQPIVLDSLYPAADSITITEFDEVTFLFAGYDPDGNELEYTWLLDSVSVATDSSHTFTTDQTSAGNYSLELLVRDNYALRDTFRFNWQIEVRNRTNLHVPIHFSTIQSALEATVSGDTVTVHPGIYPENINFGGREVRLTSLYGALRDTAYIEQTVIDGSGSGSVVVFNSGEGRNSILSGFTLTGGSAANGGGIVCQGASPRLLNLMVSGNTAVTRGGGIYCAAGAQPLLENITVAGNTAFIGGGMEFYNASPEVNRAVIRDNTASFAGGGVEFFNSAAVLSNCLILNNTATDLDGGGLSCFNNSQPVLKFCTIAGNHSVFGGALSVHQSSPQLSNSILAYHTGEYAVYVESGSPAISFCNFWDNQAGNVHNGPAGLGINVQVNANADSCDVYFNMEIVPNFSDTLSNNYQLLPYSQCIGAGIPDSTVTADLENNPRPAPVSTNPDLGAYEQERGYPEDMAIEIAYLEPGDDSLLINETDSIHFTVTAADPNGHEVHYRWWLDSLLVSEETFYDFHTDYFSAGNYQVNLQLTDEPAGFTRADTAFCWLITVLDVDQEIVVDSLFPLPDTLYISEGDSVFFLFSGYDPDGNELGLSWRLNGNLISEAETCLYVADYQAAGEQAVTLQVTDNFGARNVLFYEWVLIVANVTLIHIPADIGTIQAGIMAAAEGDTLLVAPGTYPENLNFQGKALTVTSEYLLTRSWSTVEQTIIDGINGTSVLICQSGEDSTSTLSGFTLINGSGSFGNGGGIYCRSASSPRLINLIIRDNSAYSGGALHCENNSNPTLTNVIIRSNTAFTAAAINCVNAHPYIANALIYDNYAIQNVNILACEQGAHPTFLQATITRNTAASGSSIKSSGNSHPSFLNSIIWNNTPAVFNLQDSGDITILYSNVENGWPGAGNISFDPLFADPDNNDFRLGNYSYCIGTGDAGYSLPYDLNSAARPQPAASAPDLGALENSRGIPLDGPIVINEVYPAPGPVYLDEGDSLTFYIDAYDLNAGDLSYAWELNGDTLSADPSFTCYTDSASAGSHLLILYLADDFSIYHGRSEIILAWTIFVTDVIPPDAPVNVLIDIEGDMIYLSWEAVPGAGSYRVYSSENPETGFNIDHSGIFSGTSWSAQVDSGRKFYLVKALN